MILICPRTWPQESGVLAEDTHQILSGRLHVHCTRGGFFRGEPVGGLESHTAAFQVTYSSFESNGELLQVLQASSSFAFQGVEVRGEPHWDGGFTEVLPLSATLPTVTVAPAAARGVTICPDVGCWALPGALGRHGWRLSAQTLVAAWDCTFMFSPTRMMRYWAQGVQDGEAFLQSRGY